MWAFLSTRFRRYVLLAVAVPVGAWLLERAGDAVESRRGQSTVSEALRAGGALLHRHQRGPAARRRRAG